jgi:lysophosphatidate acyltransferase
MLVLNPIETKNLEPADVEDLTRDTRELMLKELVILTEKQRGQKATFSTQISGK